MFSHRGRLWRVALGLAVGVPALAFQGCARPDALRRTDGSSTSASSEQSLPFHQSSASDESDRPAIPAGSKPAGSVPFQPRLHSRSIPAGTLITVRLENSVWLSRVHAGDLFAASLAGDITLDGVTLFARGTPVKGHVESVESATGKFGLARLTLDGIARDKETLPLETSSLFARASLGNGTTTPSSDATQTPAQAATQGSTQTAIQTKSAGYRLAKGRRLTFRLAGPLVIEDSGSVADRQ